MRADGDNHEEIELLRWELVQIVQGVVLAGGTDVGRDAATGDTVSLTGSGQARPRKGNANGGGTFVHKHANGTEVAHGVYVVTGLKSFVTGGASLVGTGLTDGIEELKDTTGGALSMNVNLMPAWGGSLNAVLEVHCSLPGGKPETEGIRLSVASFKFVQDTGFTLFHVLDD